MDNDAIVAIATPRGRGAIGVLRISGPAEAISRLAERIAGGLPPMRRATLRTFRDPHGEPVDEGLLLWFPAPRSYTGEHVLELQTHGAPVVLDQLLESALAAGARPARPGEFTERAWLNGRMDLVQAEAVADLIAAGSRSAARLALRALGGEASRRLQAIARDLETLRADLEARIDFPEDLGPDEAPRALLADLAGLRAEVLALAHAAARGRHARSGLRVVLVGPPNAGKSLLFNRLLGAERALVSPEAGTTRDAIEAELALDGVVLALCDTAGLRHATAPIEAAGVQRARAELAAADVWLFVSAPDVECAAIALREELHRTCPEGVTLIEVANKCDLVAERMTDPCPEGVAPIEVASKCDLVAERMTDPLPQPGVAPTPPREECLSVSALRGTGMAELEARLRTLASELDTGAVGLVQARHATALEELQTRLNEAETLLTSGQGPELVAEALREAAAVLDRLFGRHADPEALLGEVFARFCIGK